MKKKIFLPLLALIIVNCTLHIEDCMCQWVQCNGINEGYVFSLATIDNKIIAGTDEGVYLSTDNGCNWTQTSLNNRSVYSISINGNNIFAGTWDYGIYRSTNNGNNWIQTSLNNGTVFSIVMSGNNIFAGTQFHGVYLSTNNGDSWIQTNLDSLWISAMAISGNIIFAGTNTPGYSNDGIYTSTNNGSNWTHTTLNDVFVFSIFASGNSIYAGTDNCIFLSTNSGSNWSHILTTYSYIRSLTIIGNSIIGGTDYGVYQSTNNGINWINRNQGFTSIPSVRALLIVNNFIFAGTFGYSVWRRSLSEIIRINQISETVPSSFKLEQNFPNPFNPSTNIKYQIKENKFVSLKIFDIQGKEIETLVNEKQSPGEYEVNWDASQYPSGVYFYKLSAGDFSETKKMLLVK